MDKVKEMFLRDDRFYVRFDNKNGKQNTMPRANYVWLKHNPAFKEIPKGYVVHHLDLDKTNDDPSNLVIMQKFHHVAYHWKQKVLTPEISLDKDIGVVYFPTKMPTVQPHGSRFYVQFMQKNEFGKSILTKVWSKDGKPFHLKKDAELCAVEIWNESLILDPENTLAVIENELR